MDAAIKPIELTFYFDVSEFAPIGSHFSGAEGFARSFSLSGRCWNGDTDGRDRFDGRKARIAFAAPTSKQMAEFGAKHGVQDPCGHILIRKDVQPKRYDLQDGPAFDPAMDIAVTVAHEVLDRLFETARSTIQANRVLGLTLTVASTALPARSLRFCLLDDLDVSEDQWYPVTQFKLIPQIVRLRDTTEARPRRPSSLAQDSARLTLRLDEVRAVMYSDRLRFSGAAMSGRVTQPRELQGVQTSVDIQEYELDSLTGDYPEEAFPGVFNFYPEPGQGGQLDLTLHFTLRDSGVLIPIFLSSPTVELSVSLSAAKAQIAATKEVLRGDITSYSFSFCATK